MGLVGLVIGKPPGQRLPVSAGGVVAKTYAEFQAHIATLAVDGIRVWNNALQTADRRLRSTCAAATGVMSGSPWVAEWNANTAVARMVQHCFPSEAAFNACVAGGFEVYYQTVATGLDNSVTGLNRNGYLSDSEGPIGGQTVRTVDFIYWDGAQAQRMNPFSGTGPTPYSF